MCNDVWTLISLFKCNNIKNSSARIPGEVLVVDERSHRIYANKTSNLHPNLSRKIPKLYGVGYSKWRQTKKKISCKWNTLVL